MFCTSRRMRTARSITCCPAGVTRERLRPSRTKIWKPSSSSSSLICFETPGLGGVQLLGGRGDVEAVLGDGGEVAELVQLHGGGILAKDFPAAFRQFSVLMGGRRLPAC